MSIFRPVQLRAAYSSRTDSRCGKENTMDKNYTTPELEIISFAAEDVITTSDPIINKGTDTEIL